MIEPGGDDVFSFHRESHEYRMGSVVVPSVTQILRRAGLIRWFLSEEELRPAAKRGSDVHMIVCDIERGAPDYWTEGPYGGYVKAWTSFKSAAGYCSAAAEGRLYNSIYHYAGTYDNKGWINHGTPRQLPAVIEIKTGAPEAWHREQTAGYALCLTGNRLNPRRLARLGVYLRPNGKFHVERFDDPMDGMNFLAANSVAKLRAARRLYRDDENFDGMINGLDQYAGVEQFLKEWSIPA